MARRKCTVCGSKQWHKEPATGLVACSEGHVLQGYRNEDTERDDFGPHMMRKRTIKSERERKEEESRSNPKLYHGDRARFHYFQCLQLLFRKQIATLSQLWQLPPEFEFVCKDVWALHLSLLPSPPPPDPSIMDDTQEAYHRGPSNFRGRGDDTQDEEDDRSSASSESEEGEVDLRLRELSEASSSDEEENVAGGTRGDKGVTAQRDRRRHASEMPASTLAVLAVTCWTMRFPVIYRDFIRLVESYELPYLDPVRLQILPTSLTEHLTKQTAASLSPHAAPSVRALHSLASRLARQAYTKFGVLTPEVNAAPVLWRVVRALNGSALLYTMTKTLARSLSLPLTLHYSLAPRLTQRTKYDPSHHLSDNLPPEVSLMATAVIALKFVYGLDGQHRLAEEGEGPAESFPPLAEYIRTVRDSHEPVVESGSINTAGHGTMLDLDDDRLDDFLAFCDRALVPRGECTNDVGAELFPLERLRAARTQSTSEAHTSVPTAVSATTESEPSNATASLRPGQGYRVHSAQDRFGTVPADLDVVMARAAAWTGVEVDEVFGAVERFERRLMAWWDGERKKAKQDSAACAGEVMPR